MRQGGDYRFDPERFKLVRTRTLRVSQEQLASLLGVGREALQHWEWGEKRPDLEHLIRLGHLANVRPSYFTPPPEDIEDELRRNDEENRRTRADDAAQGNG